MVEIVPALPEEAGDLRARQLAVIRRFLEAVVENRKAAGLSGVGDSVRRCSTTGHKETKQPEGGSR